LETAARKLTVNVATAMGAPIPGVIAERLNNRDGNARHNADFIVKACNSHDALVNALRNLIDAAAVIICAIEGATDQFDTEKRALVDVTSVAENVLRDKSLSEILAAEGIQHERYENTHRNQKRRLTKNGGLIGDYTAFEAWQQLDDIRRKARSL
jgi:hypothetical protein